MQRKNQRILWLINHATLRGFEVPLLSELGFEIFASKIYPHDPSNSSCNVDYTWDKQLSIPAEDLEKLNNFNFYTDPISPRIKAIINQYFATAIVAYFPDMFDQLLQHFHGRILLRAFGLTHPTFNYFSFAQQVLLPGFKLRLISNLNRFWFAQAYPNLKEIEPDFIQRRTVTLPLGIPYSIVEKSNTWVGNKRQILFVCPHINFYESNKKNYETFKRYFGDLPHIICGAQSIPVDDPQVTGRLDHQAYYELFRTSAVMFYHSELPRHIHYHPIEAICIGQPLIFMKKGMLGYLGGRNIINACETFPEAKEKIKRVLKNDQAFINELVQQQQVILPYFLKAFSVEQWKREFLQKIIAEPLPTIAKHRRIAVICASETSVWKLLKTFSLALSLQCEIEQANQNSEIVVAYPAIWEKTVKGLNLKNKLKTRSFLYKTVTYKALQTIEEFQKTPHKLFNENYFIFEDHITQFIDCDFWLLVADAMSLPVAPLKPYALFVSDLSRLHTAKRQYPPAEEEAFLILASSASAVFSDNPQALNDTRQFLAKSADWLFFLERKMGGFACLSDEKIKMAKTYGLWIRNHDNNLRDVENRFLSHVAVDLPLEIFVLSVDIENASVFKAPCKIHKLVKSKYSLSSTFEFARDFELEVGDSHQLFLLISSASFLMITAELEDEYEWINFAYDNSVPVFAIKEHDRHHRLNDLSKQINIFDENQGAERPGFSRWMSKFTPVNEKSKLAMFRYKIWPELEKIL